MSGRPLAVGIAHLLLLLLAVTPQTARAQGWTLDAYLGRAVFDPAAASVGANNLSVGLRYATVNHGWLYLFGAAPMAAADPFWGAMGLGRRFTFGMAGPPAARWSLGADLGAHTHGYRDPATTGFGGGATFEVLPFVALREGVARVEFRTGLLHYAGSFAGESLARTIHDSGARLTLSGSAPVEVTGEARYARGEEGGYPYLGGSATLHGGRVELWAALGRWLADGLPDLSWSTGATLALAGRLDLWATLRQDATDPIYWNATRRSWSIGVSRRLGGGVRDAAPVPVASAATEGPPASAGSGVTSGATGDAAAPAATDLAPVEIVGRRVIIRLPLAMAHAAPSLAGDFTGWKPLAMRRAGHAWQVELELAPGVYHYAFGSVAGVWFVPESQPGRRDDGFGGHVAVLVVP